MKRGGALALATVCLLGQLASLAHIAVVAHVTCAEHGELVHATESAPRSALPAFYASNPAADGAHDDHCALAAFRHAPQSITDPALTAPLSLAEFRIPCSLFPVRHSDLLLLLAPKTSPPVS